MKTNNEIIEQIKSEIIADVKSGLLPWSINRFSRLHDSVDANCYGGLTEENYSCILTNGIVDIYKLDVIHSAVDDWLRKEGAK